MTKSCRQKNAKFAGAAVWLSFYVLESQEVVRPGGQCDLSDYVLNMPKTNLKHSLRLFAEKTVFYCVFLMNFFLLINTSMKKR